MTSHEFARHLLDHPDLEIVTPKVREYAGADDEFCEMMTPDAFVRKALVHDVEQDVLMVSYRYQGNPKTKVPKTKS